MDLASVVDLVLHLDKHLLEFIEAYGVWVYGLLFLIIFCETGLVVIPFLPGDSLLFTAGTLAATGAMDPVLLAALLFVAAVAGDTLNYFIGRYVGPRAFHFPDSRFFKQEYLQKTHQFFEKYGGKTIVIARFIPIVRTFAPFVAGVGTMPWQRFALFNLGGAALWIGLLLGAGYFFGNIAIVRKNLTLVIIGIIILSILPAILEVWRARRSKAA